MIFHPKIFLRILLSILFVSIIVPMSSAVGPIPDTKEKYPSWSPDGEKILFFSTGVMSEGIFIVRPDGTDLIKIDPHAGYPSWSPDGKKIILLDVFENESEGPVGIDIIEFDIKTVITTRLTFNGNSIEEEIPKYSPDGKQIVFETAHNYIYVMNSDGTDLQKIAESARFPEWSPDGEKIVYYYYKPFSVWVVNPDGTNKKEIFDDYRYSISVNFRWTSDSKYLLLNNGSNIITKVNINDPKDIEYIYDPVAHWNPKYSPDSNFVTFVSSMDGGNPDLFIARSNGSEVYNIVFDTNPRLQNATPDYFYKKIRPTPPPWPAPSPTAVPTITETPTVTPMETPALTATQTPEVPGFSLLVALASIFIVVLVRMMTLR